MYGILAVVVGVIVLLGVGSNLLSGSYIAALVTLVAGAALTVFLAVLFLAMTGPDLYVDGNGVQGRTGWRQPVAAPWSEITVDVPEDEAPQRFQLSLGSRSVTLYARSWSGFRDFVLVLASSPAAIGAITPAARGELARMLQLDDRPDPS